MLSAATILFVVFSCVILNLVWARFTFFKVTSKKARTSAYFYDPIAAVHIGTTFYLLTTNTDPISGGTVILSCIFYAFALLLFWWGIFTAKSLNYAFGSFTGQVVTAGPFRYIRHPFYTAYSIIWLTGTILFNSLIMWITLGYLVLFYLSSAKSEERAILSSTSAEKYRSYCRETNRFIPRIKPWKS